MAIEIEIWSDFCCPFCYIGEARLKRVVRDLGVEKEVTFLMHSFELDPNASHEPKIMTPENIARKYYIDVEKAKRHIIKMTKLAEEESLVFNYAKAISTNMFDAHRLAKYAEAQGHHEIWDLLYKAYFTLSLNLGDHKVLTGLAVETGLDEDEVTSVLAGDDFGEEVRNDEKDAAWRGIHGVPYFLLDRISVISGAQPYEEMRAILEHVLSVAKADQARLSKNSGHICGPDGCTLF